MKRFSEVLLILLLFLSFSPSFALKKRMAVFRFDDGSIPHWWGSGGAFEPGTGIANTATSFLVQSKAVDVMEREKLDQVLKELGFQSSGFTQEHQGELLGKLQGVDLLLMGTVTEFSVTEKEIKAGGFHLGRFGGGSIKTAVAKCALDVRVIDVKTGKVLEAYHADGEKSKKGFSLHSVNWENFSFDSSDFQATILGQATLEASKKVSDFIVSKFGTKEGYILKVDDGKVLLDFAKGEVSPGDEFSVFRLGEKIVHPVTGEVLGQEKEKVGKIKITKVHEKYSEADIERGELKVGDVVAKK